MSYAPLTKTTRLTSDEPVGFDKLLQDEWDKRRIPQVSGAVKCPFNEAVAIFTKCVRDTAEKMSASGDTQPAVIYGSFDLTEKNYDALTSKFLKNLKDGNMLTQFIESKGLTMLKFGCRSTGTLRYADGSMDVCDPTKGVLFDGSKQLTGMKSVETLYICLIKNK